MAQPPEQANQGAQAQVRVEYVTGDARLPQPLSFEGNVSENFKKFRQMFQIYLLASGRINQNSEIKVALLLNALGEEGVEVYNNFDLTAQEKNDYNRVLAEFETYVTPKKNIMYERYKFYTRNKKDGEVFDQFYQDLKTLIKTCEFANDEEMLRDRIVLGINDNKLQKKLLTMKTITLKDIMDECRSSEVMESQVSEIQKEEKKINAINKEKQKNENKNKIGNQEHKDGEFSCTRCKMRHQRRKCPAYNQICNKCGKKNHFAAACKSKSIENRRNIDDIQARSQSENGLMIENITVRNVNAVKNNEWTETIVLEGKNIKFKLDSGAEVNVLPKSVWENINVNKTLEKTNILLETYGGNNIRPLGKVKLSAMHKDKIIEEIFIVANVEGNPLLGLTSCVELGLIKRADSIETDKINVKKLFVENNKDVFNGIGKYKERCKIIIDKNAIPVVKPPRRIPLSVKEKVKQTLDKLENKKIIKKTVPSGWASNMVIVEKPNGDFRICLDPQELNKVIKRQHCLVPTVAEISANLANKEFYSVLDLKDGFYHVELDKESADLCTFSTPFGYYKFLRLPFGISVAPEIFQSINQKIFGGLKGVTVYYDDILIAGETLKEHDALLNEVLKRARKYGVKFNSDKIQYRETEVKYIGLKFSKDGMKIDEDRIRAVKELEEPKNKKEVQRILGMINFFRGFIPNLSEVSAPMRELLKNDIIFTWTGVHKSAFEKIKDLLCKAPILNNFDDKLKVVVQADSSQNGLGGCLLQNGKPVCFASRALTEAEKNYAQVEKELLAIVFAVKKFHLFTYGRSIEVHTDHKPLVALLEKNIADIGSPRLQRLRLKLIRYRITIYYVPGKNLNVPDTLSRAYIKDKVADDESMKEVVHNVHSYINISENKKIEFETETEKEAVLKQVKKYIIEGWPKEKITGELNLYFMIRNDLHIMGGIIMYNERIVVPKTLRNDMLYKLHEAHQGITKTKAFAKEWIYWPQMNKDIEEFVLKCKVCEKYRPANIKEELISHEILEEAFAKIATDICEYAGNSYLVIIDYFSKWLEVIPLKYKTSEEVIEKLQACFATHGIPKEIISDNMPYNSKKIRNFVADWDITLKTSSPRYPRSNGQAEAGVKIAKMILKKSTNLNIGLLNYRNTPIEGIGVSPAQILMNRRTRTKIPAQQKQFKREIVNTKEVGNALKNKQALMKAYHDRRTRKRDDLEVGQNVIMQKGKNWEHAKIVEKTELPRSYIVRDGQGNTYRRNKYHLRPSKNEPIIIEDTDVRQENGVQRDENSQINENANSVKDSTVNVRTSRNPPRIRKLPEKFKDYVM